MEGRKRYDKMVAKQGMTERDVEFVCTVESGYGLRVGQRVEIIDPLSKFYRMVGRVFAIYPNQPDGEPQINVECGAVRIAHEAKDVVITHKRCSPSDYTEHHTYKRCPICQRITPHSHWMRPTSTGRWVGSRKCYYCYEGGRR